MKVTTIILVLVVLYFATRGADAEEARYAGDGVKLGAAPGGTFANATIEKRAFAGGVNLV